MKSASRTIGILAAAAAAATVVLGAAGAASAAKPAPAPLESPTKSHHNPALNPYSPAVGHGYRHGVTPTVSRSKQMRAWQAANASSTYTPTGLNTLSYGGGIQGVGVTTGHSKVYLVFYGSQWGTQGTDSNGNATFSNDTYGAASAAQRMFRGIGTNGELWSADLTQWCDGPAVPVGATKCPRNANYVPYQAGGVLAGVWYDNAAASPAAASENAIGQEAINAAGHFGNVTAASNRNAYYVVLSPPGTNPDNYLTAGFCAWHDYTGDTTLLPSNPVSPYGDVAFSNQPYNIDAGASCGKNFLNAGAAGNLDGYTITLGHEWHEMISDQFPAGGWTNHSGVKGYDGYENSDECAWLSHSLPGGITNVSFGSYGTFAEQGSWSNDTNSCVTSHPIVVPGSESNTVTVTNPGNQSVLVNSYYYQQISATDSDFSARLTYSATGLPAGLTINSSGAITGTPTTAGIYTVTVIAADGTGERGSVTFTLKVGSSKVTLSTYDVYSFRGQSVYQSFYAYDSNYSYKITYSATGLPAGLTLNPATGLVTGTVASTAVTTTVTVTATDSAGASASSTFTWHVS